MIKNPQSHLIILFTFSIFHMSCMSLTTFQTPEVLEKDKKLFGVGFMQRLDESSNTNPTSEFYIRRHLFNNVDAGIRFMGIPFLLGLSIVDVKWSIIKKPIYVTLDFAVSRWALDIESKPVIGFYPMIMVGNKRLYAGYKYNYLKFESGICGIFDLDRELEISEPSIVLGSSIGKNLFIQPEVNLFFLKNGKSFSVYSLGFYFIVD